MISIITNKNQVCHEYKYKNITTE
ncbi:hypothetical protein Avbf_02776 [Armadillidium vulgare]|nr:hypothetical protein Avbf_02776 [Armadillidium vulgare]